MAKKYLLTCGTNSITPRNHGAVDIDDRGFLTETGTPVEDFGMFYMSNDPLPTEDREMFQLFLDLMDD